MPLSPEDVATFPLPGTAVPSHFSFYKNRIAYLYSRDGSLTRQLYVHDPRTGERRLLVLPPDEGLTEENVSLEQALRRERQRQRGLGVTSYQWHKNGRILVPLNGGIYVQDGDGADLRALVTETDHPALTPRFSPDGEWIAYVQDAELYVLPAAGGRPRRLTFGARGTGKTNGLAEYAAQEEMGRAMGFWWSPDSRQIAFTEVDETHIPVYRITHQGKDTVGAGAQEDHHYPFAGGPNALVRLGVIGRDGGQPVWLDLGDNKDIYLARVTWLPDGRLAAQRLNRHQTELDLMVFAVRVGGVSYLLHEKSDVWINLHQLFRPLKQEYEDGAAYIWGSERSGFMHLYLLDAAGETIRPLTSGAWPVDAIAGVDEAARTVYFLAGKDSPLEKQLYAVSFDGEEPRRITRELGTHQVAVAPDFETFIDTHAALSEPPRVTLRRLSDGERLHTIYEPADPRLANLDLPTPELVELFTGGETPLYGALFRPPQGDPPWPTIVAVYGGPHKQLVSNDWLTTITMRAQYLAQQGFLVFMLDNRGSARRGLAFEAPLKHNMGNIEVDDQVSGVHWLIEQGLADPERVGIYGWSYGGYMALMCLAQAPDVFKAGVAGAPVTTWDGYDTCYTERYMGLPQENAGGYRNSSVMAHVDNLQGSILLVHGLIDENVHFRHTARLINALITARKPYDLLLFPDERHSPRSLADRVYLEEHVRNFFEKHLKQH
ncbi:MAG: alpha/beta fold hydrolase [Candidatus Promineifilaceae bacterium]